MDDEMRRTVARLLTFLPGRGGMTFPQVVAALGPEGLGEEAVRVGLWTLIDRQQVELTQDWRVIVPA